MPLMCADTCFIFFCLVFRRMTHIWKFVLSMAANPSGVIVFIYHKTRYMHGVKQPNINNSRTSDRSRTKCFISGFVNSIFIMIRESFVLSPVPYRDSYRWCCVCAATSTWVVESFPSTNLWCKEEENKINLFAEAKAIKSKLVSNKHQSGRFRIGRFITRLHLGWVCLRRVLLQTLHRSTIELAQSPTREFKLQACNEVCIETFTLPTINKGAQLINTLQA